MFSIIKLMIELQVLYFHNYHGVNLFSYIVDGIKQIQIQNLFPGAWLSSDDFKSWLEKDTKDVYRARCKVCAKTFSVANLGVKAVESHRKRVTLKSKNVEVSKSKCRKIRKTIREYSTKSSASTSISISCKTSLA